MLLSIGSSHRHHFTVALDICQQTELRDNNPMATVIAATQIQGTNYVVLCERMRAKDIE